jgi:hypothetical protein
VREKPWSVENFCDFGQKCEWVRERFSVGVHFETLPILGLDRMEMFHVEHFPLWAGFPNCSTWNIQTVADLVADSFMPDFAIPSTGRLSWDIEGEGSWANRWYSRSTTNDHLKLVLAGTHSVIIRMDSYD